MIADPKQQPCTVERLRWSDASLGEIAQPGGTIPIRASFGSGLAIRPGDPPGIVWAIGDRGPNLKIAPMIALYGREDLRRLADRAGAKIMPRRDLGPSIARLRIEHDRVELLEVLRLTDSAGAPVSGLPMPGSVHAASEPCFDLDGAPIAADPSGLDSEGIVALADGGFLVSDEFGPSLARIDAAGRVQARFVPEKLRLDGASYPVHACLPAIASARQLNRGFEAVTMSGDGRWLFLAFQSPLAHPDTEAHEQARHVRLWRLDAATLEVAAQYLYPLDPPDSFRRDCRDGPLGWSDLKISELAWIADDRLLVLERGSRTTKIQSVRLSDDCRLPERHLARDTRPTLEQLSARGQAPAALSKTLLFSSDDAPEVAPDLEGMAILSPHELLLVNDNDFGVEGAETSFWRVRFHAPLLA